MRVTTRQAVIGLTALAALVRFGTLDLQSFEYDEAFTVFLVRMDLGGMLSTIPDTEATPPLYYVLAWLWSQAFGTGEVGLRSLSALLGTALVPLAYVAGATLVCRRVGLAVAALVAVNPYLIWMAQEARSYALMLVLSTTSFIFFLRAAGDRGGARDVLWWAVASGLSMATHYFTAFVIVPELVWLIYVRARSRQVLFAGAALLALTAALVPLAIAQRAQVATLGDMDLVQRVGAIPKKFLVGEYASRLDDPLLLGALVLVTTVGIALAAGRTDARDRSRAALAAAVGGAAIAVPVAAAVAGFDYVTARNMLPAFVPLACVVATGFAAARARRAGAVAGAALVALFAAVSVAILVRPDLQRDDWRGVARELETSGAPSVVVLDPAGGSVPLSVYMPGLTPVPESGAAVMTVNVMTLTRDGEQPQAPATTAGLRPVRSLVKASYTLERFSVDESVPITPAVLRARRPSPAGVDVLLVPVRTAGTPRRTPPAP